VSTAPFQNPSSVAPDYRRPSRRAPGLGLRCRPLARINRLPELAADLVRLRVAAIVTPGSTAAAAAGKFRDYDHSDRLQRWRGPGRAWLPALTPGGNVTGVSSLSEEIGAKRLGLLQELVPRAARFAVLVNPNPLAEAFVTDLRPAQQTAKLNGAIGRISHVTRAH
jgi:hypothetical protein